MRHDDDLPLQPRLTKTLDQLVDDRFRIEVFFGLMMISEPSSSRSIAR
jgi:hypothetical protein